MGPTCGQCHECGPKLATFGSRVDHGSFLSLKGSQEYTAFQNLIGMDKVGVNENFQYHSKHLKEKQLRLNYHEMFFREAFGPMHLLDIKVFDKLIDDFLEWYDFEFRSHKDWESETDGEMVEIEVVPVDTFLYFLENSKYFKKFM